MKKYSYLDNTATTPVDPEVLRAMERYYKEKFANPSGVYSFAQDIKKNIEIAREQMAKSLNCAS